MGVGFGMGNMVTNMMNQNNMNQQQGGAVPPPPPIVAFHVVLNNAQAGPFNLDQLKTMIAGGQITRQTMVWKAGII